MAAQLLQVSFRLNIPVDDWRQVAASLAQRFAEVPGLVWKIWAVDEATGMVGGSYLFRNEAALKGFMTSDLARMIETSPAVADLTMRGYAVMEEVTAVTRGPVPGLASRPDVAMPPAAR